MRALISRTARGRSIALSLALSLAPASARAADDAANGAPAQPALDTQIEQKVKEQVEAQLGANPYAYAPEEKAVSVAPAAGAEIGLGATIPTLHTAAMQAQARLGFSFRLTPQWSLVTAAQSGATFALNTGSADPFYGYLLRVPLELAVEVIDSNLVSYRHRRYVNVHLGFLGGPQLVLAASCNRGQCAYIQPTVAWGVGPRFGLSYSAKTRNAIGLFVTWHTDFASCPVGAAQTCAKWISTLVWSVGWTLF